MKVSKMIKKLIKKVPSATRYELEELETRLRLLYDFKNQA